LISSQNCACLCFVFCFFFFKLIIIIIIIRYTHLHQLVKLKSCESFNINKTIFFEKHYIMLQFLLVYYIFFFFFFFWFEKTLSSQKAYFVGQSEGVKPWLFQALTRNARPDSNSRPAVQISNPLSSHYALWGQQPNIIKDYWINFNLTHMVWDPSKFPFKDEIVSIFLFGSESPVNKCFHLGYPNLQKNKIKITTSVF